MVAPKGFWPDAVASLPDGRVMVSSLWHPTDPDRMNKLSNRQPVGALDAWHVGKGWSQVPGTEGMSGPNAVIVSPGGKQVCIAAWSGRKLVHVDLALDPPKVDSVETGILTTTCAGRQPAIRSSSAARRPRSSRC
jgi:hypothetical protein